MNSAVLTRAMERDRHISKFNFGVYSLDQITSEMLPTNHYMLAMNSREYPLSGHWLLAFKMYNQRPLVFNSLADKIPDPIKNYLMKTSLNGEFVTNMLQVQGNNMDTCGQYVLYVAYHLARGYSLKDILHSFKGKPLLFIENVVVNFVNQHFVLD